jgi:hypothetical protein
MFKSLDVARDIVNQISVVNEVVTFANGIFTGSAAFVTEPNIKKFNHWYSGSASGSYYHALYNTNYSASAATELADITFGISVSSSFFSGASAKTNELEKNRIYKLFAKQLLGSEREIFTIDGSSKHELIFLAIKRSQYKDEIRKGTVALNTIFSGSSGSIFNERLYTDIGADNSYERTNRGDVGELISGSTNTVGGLVFYQAGVLVLIPEVISNTSSITTNVGNAWYSTNRDYGQIAMSGAAGTLDRTIDSVRTRFRSLSFTNQSNLHSTFYFCRALNDEFNYSSNPTFIDNSGRIIPTSSSQDLTTRTYITKVGLLGENNEVLAVAALSKPIKKTPDTEYSIKVRLDY